MPLLNTRAMKLDQRQGRKDSTEQGQRAGCTNGDNIMKRRSRRFLVAAAVVALLSSPLGVQYLTAALDQHAGVTAPVAPFPHASWQQVLMAGRW